MTITVAYAPAGRRYHRALGDSDVACHQRPLSTLLVQQEVQRNEDGTWPEVRGRSACMHRHCFGSVPSASA